ncbi:putative transmembrane protein [Rhodopirellula islandica]|uniref:Transmembrane protein n=1 Tax=Rhodopirellula islandica TaxID=595434 RepID=A0A0J1BKJ4_RHOIS|nr:hypothetical protein [Rhodopirellula islandica]KLU07061.1 putative transmembrane protein [Rhodopirellula islandica]
MNWIAKTTLTVVLIIGLAVQATGQSDVVRQTDEAAAVPARTQSAVNPEDVPQALEGEFDTRDIAAATAWADQLHLADWLGPLAPLALSPFFGVACLSGLALWGPDWITDNALLGSAGPLRSVPLFCVFAVLAVVTSVPRLSKVSKPFAQAMDQLEAYSVIVILLAIKITASMTADSVGTDETQLAMETLPVYTAGIFSFTANTLILIAMTVNMLVINSVKFFFEFLVWLTPFPTVDAIFEVCNKSLCAGLMAVYALSPTLATVFNFAILLVAALIFRWAGRRVKFYRTMLLDPVLARIWPGFATPDPRGVIVFSQDSIGPYPAKSCLRLRRDDEGWLLTPATPWSPLSWGLGRDGHVLRCEASPRLIRGWLTHSIHADSGDDAVVLLKVSRRHDAHLTIVLEQCGLREHVEEQAASNESKRRDSAVEFA